MNSKKVGGILLVVSVALLIVFILSFNDLSQESEQLGCFNNEDCKPIESSLSLLHAGFGFFGFILALGFYLVFLSKGDQELFKHLEQQSSKLSSNEKFQILLLGLDRFEQAAIKQIRKQPGITQNTLRIRSDMSKAKLSQVLTTLEQKGLIKREPSKKTLAIYLKTDF